MRGNQAVQAGAAAACRVLSMLLHIRAVLSPETRQTVQEMLAGAVYVDVRRSAGREAGQASTIRSWLPMIPCVRAWTGW